MRTGLITGASRGIGRGIALNLAQQGFGLTITSRSEEDLCNLRTALLEAGSPNVVCRAADMADHESLPAMVEAHGDQFGSMAALVVNAGVGTAGLIADFPMSRLAKTIDVNFTAAMVLIQQAIPLLRKAAEDDPDRGAKVIGLTSITGVYPESGLAAYGAAKAALVSLLETVNLEESNNGVTATALAPGYVDTDMAAWVTDRVPADEMIPVADVVNLVSMLVNLSSNTMISRVVLARCGTSGFTA